MESTRVSFESDGIELVGILRVPDGDARFPGIVFTGPLSGVKEQVVGNYAERLAQRGFATLAFDHRNHGESGGEPRWHENPGGKVADLRDAISFLSARPEVDADRVALCGICLGGGYALRVGAFERRLRAVAAVGGAYMGPSDSVSMFGADGFRGTLAQLSQGAQQRFDSGEYAYIPTVSGDGSPALMPGEPYDYYGTERQTSPHWENRMTVDTLWQLLSTDLSMGAELIAPTPLLVVHGTTDDYCRPETAQRVFDRAGEPKELLWLDTPNHIDIYDREQYVGPAVEKIAEFFSRHLAAAPAAAAVS